MTLTVLRRANPDGERLPDIVSIYSDGRFLRCDQAVGSDGAFCIHHTFLLADVAELQLSEP